MTKHCLTENQMARVDFALGILQRHRAAVDRAIVAIEAIEDTREAADLAQSAMRRLEADVNAAREKRRATEAEEIRARLGVDEPAAAFPASEPSPK